MYLSTSTLADARTAARTARYDNGRAHTLLDPPTRARTRTHTGSRIDAPDRLTHARTTLDSRTHDA
eukprot:5734379-Pleurochrysis_carterae.AAC.1